MQIFDVDINTYESDGYEQYLIPYGEYLLKIKDISNAESLKGIPQLKVKFELENLPDDWDYNTLVFHTVTLIPKGEKGHGLAVHFLKELGFKPDQDGRIAFDLDDFIDLKVNATVYQEKANNGNTYNRVKDFKFYMPESAQTESRQEQEPDDVPF